MSKDKEERIETRLNWVSSISTPDQLRREIISFLKAQPRLCNDVEVHIEEPLGGVSFEKQGVVIRKHVLIIAEIICDKERYEVHFKSNVFEVSGIKIFYDIDVGIVKLIPM